MLRLPVCGIGKCGRSPLRLDGRAGAAGGRDRLSAGGGSDKILAIPKAATLAGRLLILDARDMRIREVRLARDPSCETCGKR